MKAGGSLRYDCGRGRGEQWAARLQMDEIQVLGETFRPLDGSRNLTGLCALFVEIHFVTRADAADRAELQETGNSCSFNLSVDGYPRFLICCWPVYICSCSPTAIHSSHTLCILIEYKQTSFWYLRRCSSACSCRQTKSSRRKPTQAPPCTMLNSIPSGAAQTVSKITAEPPAHT